MSDTGHEEQGSPSFSRFSYAACVLASIGVLRVLAHALFDRRPRYGGSEASDLCNLMFHHYSLQGFFGWSFTEQLSQIGHKPPLYYGGLPWLLQGKDSLSYAPLLGLNALALGLLLFGCWRLGVRLGGERCGLFAVAVTVALPAISGRSTIVGAELIQLAALVWIFEFLVRLLTEESLRTSTAVQLGSVLGAALLVKWTLGVPLLLPAAVVCFHLARHPRPLRALRFLALAAVVAVALFSLWWFPFAELGSFASAAGGEASTRADLGYSPWLYLPLWTLRQGLGLGLLPLIVVCLLAWRGRTQRAVHSRDSSLLLLLLFASVLSVFLVHSFIPHKEPRYTLLAMPGLGVLFSLCLHRVTADRGPWLHRAALLGLAALWWSSFVGPYFGDEGSHDAYSEQPLHGRVVTLDYGLEQLVRHSTFSDSQGSVVAYTLAGERWLELRDLLSWEFYARNTAPVISRLPAMPQVTEDEASRSLDLATHFVTNRPLSANEQSVLTSRGFSEVIATSLPLPDAADLRVWSRPRSLVSLEASLGVR